MIDAVEKREREPAKTHQEVPLPHAPYLFEALVLGPAIHGHLEDTLLHINKPRPLVRFPNIFSNVSRPAHYSRGFFDFSEPCGKVAIRIEGVVVAVDRGIILLRFEPAARG